MRGQEPALAQNSTSSARSGPSRAGDAFGSLAEHVQATVSRRLAGGTDTKLLFAASAPVRDYGRVVIGDGGDDGYRLAFRIADAG